MASLLCRSGNHNKVQGKVDTHSVIKKGSNAIPRRSPPSNFSVPKSLDKLANHVTVLALLLDSWHLAKHVLLLEKLQCKRIKLVSRNLYPVVARMHVVQQAPFNVLAGKQLSLLAPILRTSRDKKDREGSPARWGCLLHQLPLQFLGPAQCLFPRSTSCH